jgi:hypothetical protein
VGVPLFCAHWQFPSLSNRHCVSLLPQFWAHDEGWTHRVGHAAHKLTAAQTQSSTRVSMHLICFCSRMWGSDAGLLKAGAMCAGSSPEQHLVSKVAFLLHFAVCYPVKSFSRPLRNVRHSRSGGCSMCCAHCDLCAAVRAAT